MEYNKDKTINHPIAIQHLCCVQDFNEVVKKEDDRLKIKDEVPNFVSDVKVLNIDDAKNEKYPLEVGQERPKSMDITFAISEDDKAEMVLADFKFNMENPNNLTTEELVGKVNDSIAFLGNSIPIHNQYIFVFQPNIKHIAERKLYRRMFGKIPNNYKAMDLQELIGRYF